ncbi:c-type cytochrome [Lacipirellula parvula]|nr:cytochrome c [Lacipirellula parvula]
MMHLRQPNRLKFAATAAALLTLCAIAISTTTAWSTETKSDVKPAPAPTFNCDIAPIMFAQCASCHRPGEAAPFSLLTYKQVSKRADLVAAVTESRFMPPWHAEPIETPFHGERRLTDEQIATIQAWVDADMPEGDPADLPAAPEFTPGWQLGKPDLIVEMTDEFEVPADGPDIYHNFAIPLGLTEDKWVRAIEFRPSARTVVHHSLFYCDPSGQAVKHPKFAQQSFDGDEEDSRGRGDLGGGSNGRSLGGWAVGATPLPLPAGLAYRVPAGSSLILSTHFHPSGVAERERSVVGIYFADKKPERSFTGVQLPPLFGAISGVDIPAGEKRYTKTDSFTLPVAVDAFGANSHAHYLGKEMELTATLPDGKQIDLLRINDFDFNWQEQYQYAEFVRLPKGTRLDGRVTWDNSTDNIRNPTNPPVRVKWGRESLDEMGSVSLRMMPVNDEDLETLQNAYRDHVRAVAKERMSQRTGWRQRVKRWAAIAAAAEARQERLATE